MTWKEAASATERNRVGTQEEWEGEGIEDSGGAPRWSWRYVAR